MFLDFQMDVDQTILSSKLCFEIGLEVSPLSKLFNSRIACFYLPAPDTEDRVMQQRDDRIIKEVLVWSQGEWLFSYNQETPYSKLKVFPSRINRLHWHHN